MFGVSWESLPLVLGRKDCVLDLNCYWDMPLTEARNWHDFKNYPYCYTNLKIVPILCLMGQDVRCTMPF